MLVFISNWITFVRETFHKNTLVRHFFIITDTYVTNIQNNKNTVMTEKEKEAVRLPENAFRELKDGEEYTMEQVDSLLQNFFKKGKVN